jgi:ABC-2 type transport system ATP-binding protein
LVLRKGEILYSGSVEGMSTNNGFIELSSNNNSLLIEALEQFPNIEKVKEEEGKVIVYSKSEIDPATLNKFLADKSIYLNHLSKRKNSLEEQFLQLTGK